MSRVRGSLDIARPVDEVFDFVADQRNEPSYNPNMTASTKLTTAPLAPAPVSAQPFSAAAGHCR
jgi:hypothetical protein